MFSLHMKSYLASTILLLFSEAVQAQVLHRGAMSQMGKENFKATTLLDTLPKSKLFGLGPYGKMQGEITLLSGKPYIAVVQADGTATVSQNWKAEAPFFVYANVARWKSYQLNTQIENINELQRACNTERI
jgi:acetolactate decarboxylase